MDYSDIPRLEFSLEAQAENDKRWERLVDWWDENANNPMGALTLARLALGCHDPKEHKKVLTDAIEREHTDTVCGILAIALTELGIRSQRRRETQDYFTPE